MVTPNTPPPPWLKDVPELVSPELAQLEADIRAGTLTKPEAQPLLLHAALRQLRKALRGEAPPAP